MEHRSTIVWRKAELSVGEYWSARATPYELLAFKYFPELEWTVAVVRTGTATGSRFAVTAGTAADARALALHLLRENRDQVPREGPRARRHDHDTRR